MIRKPVKIGTQLAIVLDEKLLNQLGIHEVMDEYAEALQKLADN